MKLPKLAIENRQFTIIVFLLLFLSGLASFLTMPRSEDPQVAPSGTSVTVIYPGANPSDMEELIADPIEEKVNELDNIKKIDSYIGNGICTVGVEFTSGTDMDETYSELVQKINSIREDLPDNIFNLEINRWIMSDFVIMLQIALLSDKAGFDELDFEIERLEKELKKVKGVKKIEKHAIPEREIRISLDSEKIALMNIPLNQVMGIIQANNRNIPGGDIDIGSKRYNIKTTGSYKSMQEIKNTVINSYEGKIVYLKDIADINFDNEDNNYIARVNGKRAVFLTVNQKEGTNVFTIMEDIETKINKFEQELPDSMELYYVFNQADSVARRLNSFFGNLLQGLIIVGLVVLLAVGLRASGIVILAIPLSIFVSLGFVDLCGYGIEQMSIAGLVIALGLLVDNAIVVIENTTRFFRDGYNPIEAASKGTSQIGWAIVSATATTIFAFFPIILMKNITGDYIRSMPVTVVFTLASSLIIALTLTPYLSSKFITNREDLKKSRFKKFLEKFINNYYRKALDFTLKNPGKVVSVAVIVLFLSLLLVPFIGVSYFPKAEKPQFIINIDAPEGSNLEKTNKAARHVESHLSKIKEIKTYATNVGEGNPQIHYNVESKERDITHAQIFVELKTDNINFITNLISVLREKFSEYKTADIEVKEIEQSPHTEAPIAIKVLGSEMKVLREIAEKMEKIFRTTPGTVNTHNPQSESKVDLFVNVNREKANILGIQLSEIDKTIRTYIAGTTVSKYRDSKGEEYNIVVRLPFKDKININDFKKIYVSSVTNRHIPLSQIANLEFKSSPNQIQHFNFERCVTLTSDVLTGYNVEIVTSQILDRMKNEIELPKGYDFYISGEKESREESFGGMEKAIIIALIAIFGVLVLQFRSFSQPWIVFSAIPLAVIGSIYGLLITNNTFSFTAFVGFTALVGIVVNNSIILVDYTNQLIRKSNYKVIDALKKSGETRFTPIILTTATTIGGLLPLTLRGGSLWAPMGWTIIGGLLTSTILTLIIVPALYKLFIKLESN